LGLENRQNQVRRRLLTPRLQRPKDSVTEQESRCHDSRPPSHVLPAKLSKEYVHAPLNVHLTMTTSKIVTETFEKQMILPSPIYDARTLHSQAVGSSDRIRIVWITAATRENVGTND